MKKTWTVIGGLCDGQIKELDDSLVGGQTYCVGGQRGRKNVCHMVQYDSTRGAVTDRISGGVLAHESLSPVQAYKMLILHYSTKLGVQEVVAEPTRPFGPADLQCEIASGCGNM